jgi:CRP-like cAMP-binding protein
MEQDSELASRLKEVPLFAGLSDRELRDVVDHGKVVQHSKGHEIVREGHQTSVGFHLILDGQATVLRGENVRHRMGPGEHFGEISLLDGKPRSVTVRAEEPLRTFSITSWAFQPLLDAHPKMAHGLLLGLCAQIRAMEGTADASPT